jgi:hypothetical protein
LYVEIQDFSTEISLPTGQKVSCQEVVKMYLRGWAMEFMVDGSYVIGVRRKAHKSSKLKAESPERITHGLWLIAHS